MAASQVKFWFGFLFVSTICWLVFMVLAWIISRIMGVYVGFRVGGWRCLRDVVVKFRKGAIISVSVGEIKLSLGKSLVKHGSGFISRDPKLQVLICDLEVVLRSSNKSTKKTGSRKSRSSVTSKKGKWMVTAANMAKFLSIVVKELVLKTPKARVELKELRVDISEDGGSKPALFFKLHLLPFVAHLGEPQVSSGDQLSTFSGGDGPIYANRTSSAPFSCEEFSFSCEFSVAREEGLVVNSVEITSGEVALNLNEELFVRKRSSSDTFSHVEEANVKQYSTIKSPDKNEASRLAITKFTSMFPEKVCFNLPKLDVKFAHRRCGLLVENNIVGIELKSIKSQSIEDVGESTCLDVQLDFSEIHLLRADGVSIVEILKLDVVSSVRIPLQPTSPIRSEIDVKLGGTQCNLIMDRLKPLMQLKSSKQKKMVLREESPNLERPQSTVSKAIMWTCTVSAPDMIIVLYNLRGMPLFKGGYQSLNVVADNISSTGTSVHMDLGELNLCMADGCEECLKESLFSEETATGGSLIHIAKISLDWGKKDMDSLEGEGPAKCELTLSVDVTGLGVYLTFKRVESVISTAFTFKALMKNFSGSGKKPAESRGGRSTKPSGKGTQILKFNLDRCSINFLGDVGLDNTVIADPKRVNYGSQGGRVIVSVLADGTLRTANVMSTISDEVKTLTYCVALEIVHFNLCVNKEKHSIQVELERARSPYQEYLGDNNIPGTKVDLLDIQNAKFIQRSGTLKDVAVCSLFSVIDITARWEPDVHIALFELILRLKLLVHNQKLQGLDLGTVQVNEHKKKESSSDIQFEKQQKKKESIFAIDVETLSITGEVGDGVDAMIQVQSIFSENARIGVLLEGLIFKFNDTRIFRSSRMQISRVPKLKTEASTTWDWVIQALDVHVCMPYRLQLRAIDDSVEEMLRALKLITSAKNNLLFPIKKESVKPKKPSSTKFGCVRLCIRKLTIDIEEEPLQGWLDEHYQLIKNEARELAVRLNFLDELISRGSQSPGTTAETNNLPAEGTEIDVQDASAIDKMREEIYKQSFQSYYRACQSLEIAEGSGACTVGFQAGFKPSTSRTSLFSISATELDVSLTKIEGGDDGMIELLHKLDPICLKYNIPFSRLYGCNILLHTGSLVVQIRNYMYPLLAATSGKCEGRLVMAQQATCFQPQMIQNVYVGRWRKVCLLRSSSGTTPPMKTFLDLPIHFQKGEVSFGVGFEPAFADISYAFTVALRRANLSVRNPNASDIQPPKKEKSLPWWDEMRNYIHGNSTMYFSETRWNILATIDPYEKNDKLQILSGPMEIQQSDGRVYGFAKDFKILLTSLESLLSNCGLKPPTGTPDPFLHAPAFSVEVTMDWECESGNPLNHFLFALPNEGVARDKIYDPFRSTSLSLRWNLSLRPSFDNQSQSENVLTDSPTIIVGAHDFAWLLKFWNMNYLPPQKLRFFSRWPRFGVPRIPRSGNLALDKVMTEFMFRIDSTPTCLRHMPLDDDDPAKGLTFKMTKLKLELCWGRGKQKYTFECKRELLDLVYQGLDLHMPKVYLFKEDSPSIARLIQFTRKNSQSASMEKSVLVRNRDDGFFLSSDYFSIRKQAPKADAASLLAWQEAGRRNLETTDVRPELDNGSESDKHNQSDPSDDDGYNVVIADNCQRIFVYGLKLLWTIENRDAVLSWVGGISKAFQPPKPSPSRQYTQRKLHEEKQAQGKPEMLEGDESNPPISQPITQDPSSPSPQHMETSESLSSPSQSARVENQSQDAIMKQDGDDDSENEGTCHFMVNVIEPQFNLHSEEANGRFLLAAASGRVLARSFHSFLHIGYEVIEKALQSGEAQNLRSQPEMTWSRMEFSVMLEHVQAHVAPTDVDLGAGVQWLPKICKSSPKVKRTGALLERVFMPCDMYLRYTRHKGGTSDLKVKPLKELTFNSQNITATMTSRQFQVMLDVLINLLFARVSKPRKSGLPLQADDDEDVEEEADEVVPDGVEEVELAKVNLEQKERMHKLILDDIGKLSLSNDISEDLTPRKESDLWMVTGGRSILVQRLKKELGNAKKSRKAASASLRTALQKAAQQRLMEKEKNKSPSYAMRISLQINKVAWGMLLDGKSFAEAEINDMIYDFDRDYKDIGVARFTTKYFVVRNCLSNAKSDILLAAWNPPAEWGKKVMLGVVAKQGAPKDGSSPIDLFQVDIYPLKIHLTESMYRMMWGYFFQEEEQDSQWRQKVWKVSTSAASKRVKKGSSVQEASASSSPSRKELEVSKLGPSFSDSPKEAKSKGISGSTPELRRTSSFDRTWEETVAESVANELVQQVEQQEESSKNKLKDSKPIKSSGHSNLEEKKVGKSSQTSSSRPRKLREFHNIKISQVELLVTYEGARFPVSDLRLLMDTFHLQEYTGTWRRLFSRVKKHIIWGVLKSVTGMQGKKFKDKSHSQREAAIAATVAKEELNLSDSDGGGGGGSAGKPDHLQIAWPKRPNDGAGDGFVTSVRGLFHNQRRKAKAFVLKTMRGEAENELQHGDWSESDVEFSPFARQLTITKAKRLIRRHTKKFRSRGQKGMSSQRDSSLPSSPRETSPYGSDSSSESSPYEEEPHE